MINNIQVKDKFSFCIEQKQDKVLLLITGFPRGPYFLEKYLLLIMGP